MSFDARSLERLQQLGRSLPQRLPPPAAAPPAPVPAPSEGGGGRRHRLETETNPDALFHELVRASADGSAPPHLLERLRELEARRSQTAALGRPTTHEAGGGANRADGRPRSERRRPERGRPDPQLLREHGELYTAFQQLLLEDDEI